MYLMSILMANYDLSLSCGIPVENVITQIYMLPLLLLKLYIDTNTIGL